MSRFGCLVAALLLLLVAVAAAPPAGAELASMVADLETGSGPDPGSDPAPFVRVGPRVVFFAAAGGTFARVPWVTDGSAAGTRPLPAGALEQEIGLLGGALLWFGPGNFPAGSLWRTGGTAATTSALVSDGVASYDEAPFPWARVGETLYFFSFRRGQPGWEVWATDGTAAGTRAVAALPPAERGAAMVAHGGLLFFVTGRRAGSLPGHAPLTDFKLWRSDGTAAGTRLLRAVPGVGELRSTRGGLLWFAGDQPWVSDGTRSGTHPLFPPPGEREFGSVRVFLEDALGGRVFFFASADAGVWTLWVSDGSRRGTRPIVPGLVPGSPSTAVVGGRLYFVAVDARGFALWSSGGTASTTVPVVEVCSEPGCVLPFDVRARSVAAAGGRVVFVADDGVHGPEPWSTDGTPAGTRLLRDVCPGPCGAPSPLHATDGEAFFFARDPSLNRELWASDGTEAGTRRVTSALPPRFGDLEIDPPQLAVLGDRVVTAGWDTRNGTEPWAFDRAGRGGALLADLGGGNEPGSDPSHLAALGETLLFAACDGVRLSFWASGGTAGTATELVEAPEPGCGFPQSPDPWGVPLISVAAGRGWLRSGDLWATDGTPGGTDRLTDFGTAFERNRVSTPVVEAGGRAVFGVTFGSPSNATSSELWVTDGTPAGTHAIGGLPDFRSTVQRPLAAAGGLYFWADDGSQGFGAWRLAPALDAVTRLSAHPPAEFAHLLPSGFVASGDRVFWLVRVTVDEGETSHFESRLWRSDGTPAGTVEVAPPSLDGAAQSPTDLAAAGDALLLFTTTTSPAEFRARLWTIDGEGGAALVRDLGGRTFVGEVVPRGDEAAFLVFDEGDGSRLVLYRTDGTAAGTAEAADFGLLGVNVVRELTPAGGRLVFAAGAGELNTELWSTEGSQATTRRLQEIAPGVPGSRPAEFTVAGPSVYFAADDGLHGRELWSLPLDLAAPCRPSATALCLGGGRFRAELFRNDRLGARAAGRAVAWSSDAGAFWFYDHGNPEAVVKIVDGGTVNGSFWLFYGSLTDAKVALTVTDLETGDVRRYPSFAGALPPFADLGAFPGDPAGAAAASTAAAPRVLEPVAGSAAPLGGPCTPTGARLCLHGGHFAVELIWRDRDGVERPAHAFAHGDRAGYFSFYGARDVQAAMKLLDGRGIDGAFWLFATALTDLEYTLVVTDTAAGTVHSFLKPAGELSRLVWFFPGGLFQPPSPRE